MKKVLFLLIGLFLTVSVFAQNNVQVDVYYFHITHRCNTCISIEAQVKKTLDTHFAAQLQDGSVKLHVINCELPENKVISEKYLAYGSTLAITRTVQGKEIVEDITGWAFQKVHTPEVFISELKAKIDEAIKNQ